MASLPVELLLGIYLGVLTGIIPGLVAWGLGFVFKYFTGVTIPGLGVVVLALAIAGVNGGLLALNDQTILASGERTIVAIIVVLMIALYAHSAGDKLGANLPRRLNLRKLTERTLSTDVVELVGGRGEVTITVSGEVADMEGYPPLPAALRSTIRDESWTFPADLPLSELETRVADRLRTEHDLSAASVRLDERARAAVSAAPPVGSLSKRVPTGARAVSVPTLVPTGLARGDEVTVVPGDGPRVDGVVVSAKSGEKKEQQTDDGGEPQTVTAPTASGGDGRVTVAVARADAETVIRADSARLLVRSRGIRREFELVSLLRRAGKRFRKLTVRDEALLDGVTLGELTVRDSYGVAVLAVHHRGKWSLAPRGHQVVSGGDELFVAGTRDELARFEEAVV